MIRVVTPQREAVRPDTAEMVMAAWRTNDRVMTELVRQLPPALWEIEVPSVPRRTIRAIVAQVHNSRCSWVRTLGREHGLIAPDHVDPRRVARRELVAALKQSGAGIEAILSLGLSNGWQVPPSKGYVWRNLSLDVAHVLTYFVGHEAHHRGQIVMVSRQTGHRLPPSTVNRLWWWR